MTVLEEVENLIRFELSAHPLAKRFFIEGSDATEHKPIPSSPEEVQRMLPLYVLAFGKAIKLLAEKLDALEAENGA